MKSQNQLKYFLNTNVGTYGITKDNIAYMCCSSVCLHQIFKPFGFSRLDSFYLFPPLHSPKIFGIWVWPGEQAVGNAYHRDSCFCAVRPWFVSCSLGRTFIHAAGPGLGGTHLFLSSTIATPTPPPRGPQVIKLILSKLIFIEEYQQFGHIKISNW